MTASRPNLSLAIKTWSYPHYRCMLSLEVARVALSPLAGCTKQCRRKSQTINRQRGKEEISYGRAAPMNIIIWVKICLAGGGILPVTRYWGSRWNPLGLVTSDSTCHSALLLRVVVKPVQALINLVRAIQMLSYYRKRACRGRKAFAHDSEGPLNIQLTIALRPMYLNIRIQIIQPINFLILMMRQRRSGWNGERCSRGSPTTGKQTQPELPHLITYHFAVVAFNDRAVATEFQWVLKVALKWLEGIGQLKVLTCRTAEPSRPYAPGTERQLHNRTLRIHTRYASQERGRFNSYGRCGMITHESMNRDRPCCACTELVVYSRSLPG